MVDPDGKVKELGVAFGEIWRPVDRLRIANLRIDALDAYDSNDVPFNPPSNLDSLLVRIR